MFISSSSLSVIPRQQLVRVQCRQSICTSQIIKTTAADLNARAANSPLDCWCGVTFAYLHRIIDNTAIRRIFSAPLLLPVRSRSTPRVFYGYNDPRYPLSSDNILRSSRLSLHVACLTNEVASFLSNRVADTCLWRDLKFRARAWKKSQSRLA